jgi:hypothetical protein
VDGGPSLNLAGRNLTNADVGDLESNSIFFPQGFEVRQLAQRNWSAEIRYGW